jgi:hypothetical protein
MCLRSVLEGRLFVCFALFVLMRSTGPGCFRLCSCCLWKALSEEGLSMRRGAWAWFRGVWSRGAKVLEY